MHGPSIQYSLSHFCPLLSSRGDNTFCCSSKGQSSTFLHYRTLTCQSVRQQMELNRKRERERESEREIFCGRNEKIKYLLVWADLFWLMTSHSSDTFSQHGVLCPQHNVTPKLLLLQVYLNDTLLITVLTRSNTGMKETRGCYTGEQ